MGQLGAASGANIFSSNKQIQASARQSNDSNMHHLDIDERNKDAIEYLSTHISGQAMLKELEEKRKRYLERIQEAMILHENELKKKSINTETLLRDLELVAQSLTDRNKKMDEFFQLKRKIGEAQKESSEEQKNNQESAQDNKDDNNTEKDVES